MKVLVIGDIYGELGRKAIEIFVQSIKVKESIDLIIANVENVTHGKGLSYKHFLELKKHGIDVMTSGNHIFFREETRNFINYKECETLLRPYNHNPYHPGKGTVVVICKGKRVRITNLIGNCLMPSNSDNVFFALENIIEKNKNQQDIHLVDFHAETTSEKISLALNFKKDLTALWGTHTHVQTADERVIENMAFITDVGMTGPMEGSIGASSKEVIEKLKTSLPAIFRPHTRGKIQFNAIIIEIDDYTNKTKNIKRIFEIV